MRLIGDRNGGKIIIMEEKKERKERSYDLTTLTVLQLYYVLNCFY